MDLQTAKIENKCPRTEIAAYLDGELSPCEELKLEGHFAVCRPCASEFNGQKKLLCALDIAFETGQEQFHLPESFTKTVVIKAESNVSGLRRPEERFRALFVCAVLFLLIILGLGSETEAVFSTFAKFAEQVFAVGSFAAHLVYDIGVAAAGILRLLSSQLIFNSAFPIFIWSLVLLSMMFVLLRFTAKFNRSKI